MTEAQARECGAYFGPWHRHFAWLPIWTPRGYAWLRCVERRWVFKEWLPVPIMGGWEYR